MIKVRLQFLPSNSAFNIAIGASGWQLEHFLLAHIFQAQSGSPHPGLPIIKRGEEPGRNERIAQALERKRQREAAIEAGDI